LTKAILPCRINYEALKNGGRLMNKILGAVFALTVMLSLVLLPVAVLAADGEAGVAKCEWDTMKWEDNQNSWNLYLMHWGRTPITAMSRLAGLAGPNIGGIPVDCHYGYGSDPLKCSNSGCAGCRAEEEGFLAGCSDIASCTDSLSGTSCPAVGMKEGDCPDKPIYKMAKCCCCWGISLAFAGKSWAGADIGTHPRVVNTHPNHFGLESGGASNHGGDWGLTGAPHTECIAQTWALQDNLRVNPGVNK
jgi:hypothetical protein